MQTEMIDGEAVPVVEVAKSAAQTTPKSEELKIDTTPADAQISTYNQNGITEARDTTSTREVVGADVVPLDYQYDEKQMLQNMSLAVSADIEDVKEEDLLKDETFGYASKKMYRTMNGEDFKGSDVEATQYGIDLMRKVENILYNPSDENLLGFVSRVDDMSPEEAKTALYMMDMFEAKEFTAKGVAEAVGYMGTDVANYIGVSTLGWGFAGKAAAKETAKVGMMQALKAKAFSDIGTGVIEGAAYGAAFEHGKQRISEEGGQGYDTGSVGLNTLIGGTFGGVAGKYLPELFDYAGEKVAKWAQAKNFKQEVQAAADAGDEDAMQVLSDMDNMDGYFKRKIIDSEESRVGQLVTGMQYMSPVKSSSSRSRRHDARSTSDRTGIITQNDIKSQNSVDELIASTASLGAKQKRQKLSAAMRDATPDDKQKLIAALKADAPAPKPKSEKQVEVIKEQEDFNSQFYSKLEHEANKIPDDMEFENSQAAVDYLKKQGVKQSELDAARLDGKSEVPLTGKVLKDVLSQRPDKIQKRVYTEDDFGGGGGNLSREDWKSEWTTRYDNEQVSSGETGTGIRVVDDYTGVEGEIGYLYDYDRYVDDSGHEYSYDEVKSDFMEYYADDYIETAKADMADELADGSADMNDVLEKAWDDVENDGVVNDYYYNKERFETSDGNTFDDLDDAVEHTYDNMFDDYQNIAEESGMEGNSFEGYTVDGGEEYRMEVYQAEDFTSSKDLHEEPHLGADYSNDMKHGNENVVVHARLKTREDAEGKTGDVAEEVQSQWEQDWRGEGGDTPPSKDVLKKAESRIAEIKELYKTKRVEKSDIVEKISDEKVIFSDLDKEESYLTNKTDMANEDEAGYIKEVERIMKAQNDSVLRKTELERDMRAISDEIVSLNDEAKKLDKEVINWTPSETATPIIKKRTQYEKMVLLDNVLNSIKEDKDYFGWINGHIQNGSATPESQLVGMTNAYDKEMPRIIQKSTGETPYMASFEDGMPVKVAGDDNFKDKIYWDSKTVENDIEHFDNMTNDKWYWRIDLTEAVKNKLKDAKIQMFGVGGAALVGANGASLEEGENNAN